MVDHFEILRGLRAKLKSLVVASTGTTDLEATATGYSRVTGSFLTDGFTPGMEVSPSGFTNLTPRLVTGVTATEITVLGTVPVEASAPGRSLTVGLPAMRAWENMAFIPTDGRWYIDEDYLPGPVARVTFHELDSNPSYVVTVYGIAGKGVEGLYKVSDAILNLFPPNSFITLADGHVAIVRGDPAPFKGQVLPEGTSHALVVITVPLWVRTTNNI